MITVATIVEGDGEVAAVPILLRRLSAWKTPATAANVLRPIRVRRDRFLNREDEFRRHLLLAANKCGQDGWVLVPLDADDDCPAKLGPKTLRRARAVISHRRVSVVLANREFEAWLIAAAESLEGQRGFRFASSKAEEGADSIRDAKGWMRERMARRTVRTGRSPISRLFPPGWTWQRRSGTADRFGSSVANGTGSRVEGLLGYSSLATVSASWIAWSIGGPGGKRDPGLPPSTGRCRRSSAV